MTWRRSNVPLPLGAGRAKETAGPALSASASWGQFANYENRGASLI